MCVRWLATVRSPRNSEAATSWLVRPSATSAATRRSASVSSSLFAGGRPPMRASSERALAAHSGAGSRSKISLAPSRYARAAPRRDRKSPGTVERAGALLPRRQLLLCFPQVADCDQRFECVRELETVARLEEHRGVTDFPAPSQVPECLFGFAMRELDEAEDRSMPGFGNPNPLGLRASEGAR